MDASKAITLVVEHIRARGLDYPTEGLEADRFEAGWRVYAPVEVDESDPMAFLDMPVGRSVFLVGESGRVVESSSSVPPGEAEARFTAEERAAGQGGSPEAEFMAEFQRGFEGAAAQGPPVASGFTVVDRPPDHQDEAIAAEASRLVDPIVRQLALLGPRGWEWFSAELAFTVSAEVAQVRFWSGDQSVQVPVPESVAVAVRQHRQVAARMSAGPWWRLLLKVTNRGETTVEYDYGDEPFPEDQLLPAEYYRDDLRAYPRPKVPVWIAGYVAGPAAQGREPHLAAHAEAADTAGGRTATVVPRFPALPDILARWTLISAAYAGVRSGWGPRLYPGCAWYENEHRSGATLFLLPGDRAVLSGGKWGSALLEAAYQTGGALPDLYTGAPAWVNDTVLNTRNRNGLLSFCLWWANGRWHRGATDTLGELDDPLPPVRTAEDTVRAMTSQTGPDSAHLCESLLAAATERRVTAQHVSNLFANRPNTDVGSAVNQLSLAGLLA